MSSLIGRRELPPRLRRLEAEATAILWEAAASFRRPVMLYSIGKDSGVMLHLALKAFYPGKPPFPLLHVNTGWKFAEMISFRNRICTSLNLELISHTNIVGKDLSPFDDASHYTRVMKTEALRAALTDGGFDAVLGGARRDEDSSRAKERIFSHRNSAHVWDPRNQRPELWGLFNTQIRTGDSMRIFPLSNWTELDVWLYIEAEDIPVVPLYLARERPVVQRNGRLIMVDDERLPMQPGEVPERRSIRFRSLGCYPLCAAVESSARTVADVIEETRISELSERNGRMIDVDPLHSMERKKREGYF